MKKALIISCFDWYEKRIEPISEILKKSGYNVQIVLSDFDHYEKKYKCYHLNNCEYVHVHKYSSNISLKRLLSHYFFSKNIYKMLIKRNPDMVYALLPPNTLAKECIKYKTKNKKVKIVFDIIDMWPESFPIDFVKKSFPYIFWKNMRNKNLKYADYVFTECNLYQDELANFLPKNSSTLYLFKKQSEIEIKKIHSIINMYEANLKKIILGYVGSINNIVDIDAIKKVVVLLSQKYEVELRIIGDGENRDKLLKSLEYEKVKVIYYGMEFNELKKIDILASCDFGLNLMHLSLKVGLTIKSIDYFSYGLPIINNIQGDTWKLVKEENIGINFNESTFFEDIENFNYDKTKHIEITKLYYDKFSKNAFIARLRSEMNLNYV